MKNSIYMINQQVENNKSTKEQIAKLNKKLENSDAYLVKKLCNHFATSDELLDVKSLLEMLRYKNTTKIVENVIIKRGLKPEEYTGETLNIIERFSESSTKKTYKYLKENFDKLDNKIKLKIALFCSGLIALNIKFDFMGNYLAEKYDLKEYSLDSSSCVGLSGYNYELYQSVLRIVMLKDDVEGSKVIALKTGVYKNKIIDIFESTLSQYDLIQIYLEDIDGEIYPSVTKGRYDSFKSEKSTLEERMLEVIEYVAKRHPYYGVDENNDDDNY
jgi:hypothetical protein